MVDFSKNKPSEQQLQEIVEYIDGHHGKLSYILIADPELPITPTTSRVGGLPYWNFARPYPCDDQGTPLCFMCQINLQEVTNTPLSARLQELKLNNNADKLPSRGLLQFFALKDEQFGCTFGADSKLSKVVYTEDISEGQNLSMEQLRIRIAEQGLDEAVLSNIRLSEQTQVYEDEYWPITGEIALRFQAVSAVPSIGDFGLRAQIIGEAVNAVLGTNLEQGSDEFMDAIDVLEEECELSEVLTNTRDIAEQDVNKVIGWLLGYPDFTQDNPVEYDQTLERFDTLLLCLNGSSHIGDKFDMLWGDCGIADFFINGEKFAQKDFSDVFYTWDCC